VLGVLEVLEVLEVLVSRADTAWES